jgi:hypothetical protein|tara:strand:+ start:396 stop:599 length:204 start_codon:yes stop_codon:yes gene_type:complete
MEKLGVFFAAIGMIIVIAVLMAWPTQWLWNNALIGAIDGLNPIGFWQALGINVLCGILFRNSTTSSK